MSGTGKSGSLSRRGIVTMGDSRRDRDDPRRHKFRQVTGKPYALDKEGFVTDFVEFSVVGIRNCVST